MATPGSYTLPQIRRGDTYPARKLIKSLTINGLPVEIASARMQIRDKTTDAVQYEWSTLGGTITLSTTDATNDTLELAELAETDTEAFLTGSRQPYDLEVTTSVGDVLTLLAGTVAINEDVTR